ncbi:hypothetical protein SI65_02023 [Aspergillus cristatus]|uniref:3,2-trans-enoyl-CoA isomerase n=1 Tax=Aspergillus cristatus TaxID=573508 RepID=A0A1E3BTY7_ASPCR|nr:hypothetical protein SI65_02023 [Aspergillus cristatus]
MYPANPQTWAPWIPALAVNNIELAGAFYSHPKILVTALNGPAIGLSAAMIAHSDLIFATPEAYLLTPFSSLGLVTEGGASIAFVQRMGISKAKEALLFSRRITAEELLRSGFVNRILDPGKDEGRFQEMVKGEIEGAPGDREFGNQAVKEFMGGLRRFAEGIPQAEFEKIATGAKRHKL